MPETPRWRSDLRFWRRNVDADLDDELTFHFEQRVAEFVAEGMGRAEAEALARVRFGDLADTREALRNIGERVGRRRDWAQVFDNLRLDVVHATRGLRRAPGLAVVCIVTIALGVGANGAMFSLADRLFARPPAGVGDPASLRRVYARTTWTVGQVESIRSGFPYRVFALLDSSWAPRVRLAAYSAPDTMSMRVGEGSMVVHGSYVSESYMQVLGVRPALGRFFAADEEVLGTPRRVAVISNRVWHRRFNGDSTVIGRNVEIDGQATTIIGVAAAGFEGPDLSATDVWMPIPARPGPADGWWYKSFFSGTYFQLIGRVAADTPDAWINSAGTTVVRRSYVDQMSSRPTTALRDSLATILAGPVLESLGPSIKPAPEVAIAARLVGVTIIVLLIACANVASLLLARALGRRREIAVRIALGVSRSRLVVQLLCEGIIIAVAAGVAALVVSLWAGNALRVLIMPHTHWTGSVIDGRVILFIAIVAIGTGLLAGIVPALQASRPELSEALRSGTRDGGPGRTGTRLRRLLLVVQVAMSVLLLYGGGLFVHSLLRLRAIDLGFDAERVIYGTALPRAPSSGVDWNADLPDMARRLRAVASRLEARPGVERVGMSTGGPMGGYAMMRVSYPDGSAVPEIGQRDPAWYAATASYFAVTGSRIVRGRAFTVDDRGAAVLVVNETAARAYWPQRDALGQCLRLFTRTSPCLTVIGIVRDAHMQGIIENPMVQLITPLGEDSVGVFRGASYVIVRSAPGRVAAVRTLVRRELESEFPTRAAYFVKSVDETMATELRPWRVGLLLFGGFGALALVIATLGTYSVLSYNVTQRLHEMGVRIALGARATDVMRLVVGQGLRLAMTGVVAGVVVSLLASRVLRSLLYETSTGEPMVMVAVAAVLVAIAGLASTVPARRAARVDPVKVMRHD